MNNYTKLQYTKFDGGGVILNDDNVIVCDGDPETLTAPSDDAMKEIVLRFNAHDELLGALDDVRTCLMQIMG